MIFQCNRIDDEPDRLSNCLLVYDPEWNKWAELSHMKYSKYRCSAVVLNGEIYVMGKLVLILAIQSKKDFVANMDQIVILWTYKVHLNRQKSHLILLIMTYLTVSMLSYS